MPHDKIRAAARRRMAQTGEPYAAARRAVVAEYRGRKSRVRMPDGGYALQMSGEIHDWLAGLRDTDPSVAIVVVQALAALLNEGERLGEPLVVSTFESWPWALAEGLDRSYRERVARLTAVRRGEADADALAEDIGTQATELDSALAQLRDLRRRLLDAGRTEEAGQTAGALASAEQQAAKLRRLRPEVDETRHRLRTENQRLQADVTSFRARKEVLKASYIAARSSLLAYQVIESTNQASDTGDQQPADHREAASTAEARLLADVTTQMEQELGHEAWPPGLMELRPVGPGDTSIRFLFAIESPGTVLLIAVLDGPEAVQDQDLEAILLSAERLRRFRSDQAPEAAAFGYNDTRSFLAEFYPGQAGETGGAG